MKGLANSYYFRFVDKYEAWTMVKLGDEVSATAQHWNLG
jgi:hypothetical protein